jgi:hypothetical protein
MTRDRSPFRYVPWVGRDAVVWPFRWFVFAIGVVCFIVWRFAEKMHVPSRPSTAFGNSGMPLPENVAEMMQISVWNTVMTVTILMTIGGIVGLDLERGFYRSFFSKPMSPLWYYAQRWLAGAAVVLLCPVVFGLGLALALHGTTGLSWDLMGQIGLAYLLVGGATLLLSMFSSKGWLLVFLISFVQNILGGIGRPGGVNILPAWLVVMHKALPPFQLLRPGLPVPHGGDLALLVGYGAGMLIVSAVVLRMRPLGSGINS